MGGISKRGDRYLRKQLVHGARALVSILKAMWFGVHLRPEMIKPFLLRA